MEISTEERLAGLALRYGKCSFTPEVLYIFFGK
jgi:hypothetical protein